MDASKARHQGHLIVGVEGYDLTPDERHWLVHPDVDGVILFSRNFKSRDQLIQLCDHIHSLRSPALTIYVDHEGGHVQRFQHESFTDLPYLYELGRLYDQNPEAALKASFEHGATVARDMRAVGIDVSFAPVLDLYSEQSRVINKRAFHADPYAVIALASAHIKGLNAEGMPAIGKHFPGHGLLQADTHVEAGVDNQREFDQLWACDLLPYRELTSQLDGVMAGHLTFEKIEKDVIATQSSFWLQEILRQRLHFKGLIFSDDLEMAAAKTHASPLAVQTACLQAGCDRVIWGNLKGWWQCLLSL